MYFIKPCERSAIQPVSQRRDEREAISLGLAIPTNATAFSKHKIYFIIKVISLFAMMAAPTMFFSSFILCKHARQGDKVNSVEEACAKCFAVH